MRRYSEAMLAAMGDEELQALAAQARGRDPLRRLAVRDPGGYARLRRLAERTVDERRRADLVLQAKVMKSHRDPGAWQRFGFADLFGGVS